MPARQETFCAKPPKDKYNSNKARIIYILNNCSLKQDLDGVPGDEMGGWGSTDAASDRPERHRLDEMLHRMARS